MLNLFKGSTTKHDRREAGGCGCGSHLAHGAPNTAEQTEESCCSGPGQNAEEQHAAVHSKHASHHPHASCCGGHFATKPAHERAERTR